MPTSALAPDQTDTVGRKTIAPLEFLPLPPHPKNEREQAEPEINDKKRDAGEDADETDADLMEHGGCGLGGFLAGNSVEEGRDGRSGGLPDRLRGRCEAFVGVGEQGQGSLFPS